MTRTQVSTRELEALEGAKAAAEAYLDKERDLLDSRATLLQLFLRDGQVSARQLASWMLRTRRRRTLHAKHGRR